MHARVSSHTTAIFVTIGFSAVGVLGDYFLKLASQQAVPLRSGWFYIGFAPTFTICAPPAGPRCVET